MVRSKTSPQFAHCMVKPSERVAVIAVAHRGQRQPEDGAVGSEIGRDGAEQAASIRAFMSRESPISPGTQTSSPARSIISEAQRGQNTMKLTKIPRSTETRP